jgi:hypothetical protein
VADPTTPRDRAVEVVEAVMPADTVHTRAYGTVGIAPEVGDIVDALLANPEVLRALAEQAALDVAATEDRRALDAIAELCGARAGDHRDNVVMVVRSMLQDPAVHNARRARALAVVDRLVAALQNLIDDSPDPGTEALGAVWEGRSFLRQGGGATATEWGARWSDGGYCPAVPATSEEFARQHARMFGTRPIRREVGPWVYADTGEPAFPADKPEEGTR